MTIASDGTQVLVSRLVYARVVLPMGVEVDMDMERLWPDVFVFDGDPPEDDGYSSSDRNDECDEDEVFVNAPRVDSSVFPLPTSPLPHIPHPQLPVPKFPDAPKMPLPHVPCPSPERAFARIQTKFPKSGDFRPSQDAFVAFARCKI